MNDKTKSLNTVIWQIRRLFQRLACESNELLSQFDISASHRAVLEILSNVEPETVPNMAKNYDASRQHVQKIVNELATKGLVETHENPSHKRSVLVVRTNKGKKLLEKIKKMEEKIYLHMMQHLDETSLQQTGETLSVFNMFMHSQTWQTIKSEHLRT